MMDDPRPADWREKQRGYRDEDKGSAGEIQGRTGEVEEGEIANRDC